MAKDVLKYSCHLLVSLSDQFTWSYYNLISLFEFKSQISNIR